ncbi:DUF763 domain-containing protein [Afifella marina]|uniref:DUF763 domain-containing protein n=1 Tax=Afifella marina DSM 2698 TaxID=1120955 RepID=A0A1G5M5M4_AFIMA|nr:DUF763 domain-containing protein [Afifella marina]MBK1622935.1 DUF763 domain-containing protein [Afifella marina DSM 2698]MBK1625929.1 DUF763 domain-containing protein [Afifella marina]MBK5917753.1 hypothetical protein [Afifella marina]RAI23667.1 hypothetical protein CH311_02000 [Afifella marina DSM 2698]SCZ20497.1 hypothetical protein SAMN03080610_00148 [Afifella marina DSM 2698]
MVRRAGSADLPLHNGRVPAWLGQRMTALGTVMTEAIVHHYGRDEFLRRLSHPFWFQSFGAVMGMDWHSSGITTSVIGALKRGLAPLSGELGLHVCGGRGRHSRKTPDELVAIGGRVGFDGAALSRASRLVAKVDSAALQDGFDLYLHGFIVTDDGRWVVIQQGMNGETRLARRYHWLSEDLTSFVDAPHAAIEGRNQGRIVNLADHRAAASRERQIDLLRNVGVTGIVREFAALDGRPEPAPEEEAPLLPHLMMPAHHDVRPKDVVSRRLHGALAAAAECGPEDFSELLLTPGVGARTVRSLAMVAEVVHGAPCRFTDPARFSLAHGGKDRHPFPVPTKVYDETIRVMRRAVDRAKLGQDDKLEAIKRLDREARRLETVADGPTLAEYTGEEMRHSAAYGGRSVFGWESEVQAAARPREKPKKAKSDGAQAAKPVRARKPAPPAKDLFAGDLFSEDRLNAAPERGRRRRSV